MARVASYDYYTGAPDLSPNGAPTVLPGYGPNTRTIMQVYVAPSAPAPAFNLTKLQNAFKHQPNGSGVFESSQHPIIVGQAAYNSAYGSNFAAAGDCSTNVTAARCEGTSASATPAVQLQHLAQPDDAADHPAAAQGDPRRDECDELRRVRAHAGQPRRGERQPAGGSGQRHPSTRMSTHRPS